MSTDLNHLLKNLSPTLSGESYVYVDFGRKSPPIEITENVFALFLEDEGWNVVLTKACADKMGYAYQGIFNKLSLGVYSDLQAIGLTAAVSTALASHQISANVVAALHHDHVLVPQKDGVRALEILQLLTGDC